MELAALLAFSHVASHGGFGLASRATGRPKATLSRRVAELEASLGVRLIERTSGGRLRLTPDGATLHARTEGPLRDIAEAADAVVTGAEKVQGRLRISSAVLFANTHLGKIAAAFAAAHPRVQLEIHADDRLVDPVEEGFDIVIRANPDPGERLVGRCFVRTERLAVAAPTLPLPRSGQAVPAVWRSLDESNQVWRLRSGAKTRLLKPCSTLCLSSLFMVRDAVLAGAGAALLPRTMVDDDLARGRLVSWGAQEGTQTELWALHTSRTLVSRKVRAFLDCLESAFPTAGAGR